MVGSMKEHDRAKYYESDDGLRWVGKPCEPKELFVEVLAHTIGHRLNLPVLRFATCRTDGIFLTQAVETPTHWVKDRMVEISNLREMGGVLLLDLLVYNHDRHDQNVLLDMEETPKIWAIDFGKAKAQNVMEFSDGEVEVFDPSGVYLEIPSRIYLEGARSCLDEISALSPEFFRNSVGIAVESSGLTYSFDTVVEVLIYRAKNMEDLLAEFEGRLR
jgi:hypothetical protein